MQKHAKKALKCAKTIRRKKCKNISTDSARNERYGKQLNDNLTITELVKTKLSITESITEFDKKKLQIT